MKLTLINYAHPISGETKSTLLGLHWDDNPEQVITEIEEVMVPVSINFDENIVSQVYALAQVRRDMTRDNPIAIKLPGLSDIAVRLYQMLVQGQNQTFLFLKPVKTIDKTVYIFSHWYYGSAV